MWLLSKQRNQCKAFSYQLIFILALMLYAPPLSGVYVCVYMCVHLSYPAEDGHQVMLAHGEHIDVLDDHHLIVVFVEDGVVQHICGGNSEQLIACVYLFTKSDR